MHSYHEEPLNINLHYRLQSIILLAIKLTPPRVLCWLGRGLASVKKQDVRKLLEFAIFLVSNLDMTGVGLSTGE